MNTVDYGTYVLYFDAVAVGRDYGYKLLIICTKESS